MNIFLGNEKATEGYRKPIDPDDYTHEQLVVKAEKMGVSTKLEPMKANSKDCPDDLLAARINDFVYKRRVPGKRILEISIPIDERLDIAFRNIVSPGGIWENHAEKGSKPTWVEGDHKTLVEMLSDHFGTTDSKGKKTPLKIGRPSGWVQTFTD